MATFNVLRNSVIRNSMSCRHDTNSGYSVSWDKDNDFKGYGEQGSLTTRLVWDGNYFAVATSGTVFIGPDTDQAPFDGGVYNKVKATFRIEPLQDNILPTTGRIQFQTSNDPTYNSLKTVDFSVNPDNAYNEYTIDMSTVKEWSGQITRIRLFPFVDGQPGDIVHFKSLKATSPSTFSCDTIFNGPLCSRYSDYSHPCPWTGSGGSCTGISTDDGINIVEGVNDRLLVNINGYGEQAVTLSPVSGARLEDIARDIEEKLSNIAIGGYAGNKVEVSLGKLSIVADDTREASSSVVVSDTQAARDLGFFDSEGNDVSEKLSGVEAASRYEPAGTIQLSKGEIAHFYLPDLGLSENSISLDPRRYAVQAGRPDYAEVQKEQKINFFDKTIVDFTNPVTNNGIITHLSYSGDARSTTEFVFFRPYADGSLKKIGSVPLGTLTGSLIDKVFEKNTEFSVRKGDLFGIYDGQIDAGRIEERPNASYFLLDGNLDDGAVVSSPPVDGRGEAGLRMFAHGADRETEAVLDIEFEQPELLEEITVVAKEEERTEEVNLTQAVIGGVNGGPYIETETGVDKFGDPAPAMTDLFAATDGIKYTEPNAPALHPSWLDSFFSPADKYDQTEFSVTLDFAKGIPVFFDINRVVLYFRDVSNVKFFALEYPVTTDDSDNDRYWGFVAEKYSSVSLDGNHLAPDTHPLYTVPMQATVAEFEDSYQLLEYRIADFSFDSVKARAIRYHAKNFDFVDDVNSSDFSDYSLSPSPYILEIETYAESTPKASIADNFYFESSNDGLNYVIHDTTRNDGPTSARYLMGYPMKHVKAHILPQGKLEVKGFLASLSQAHTRLKTNAGELTTSLGFAKDDFSSYETIEVINDEEEAYNFFIDIAAQRNPVERCILWNKLSSPDSLVQSEIGPAPAITKRDPYYPRETNYALNAPAYVVDPFWMLNRGAVCYISYDHGATWESRGNVLSDYNLNTTLDSISSLASSYQFVYIILDLGDVYDLDTVQAVRPASGSRVDFSDPLYSSRDVADPDTLDIVSDFVSTKEEARWLRFRAFSKEAGEDSIAELGFVRASLDVLSKRNTRKIPWVKADKLTNYVFGLSTSNSCGEGWQCAKSGFNNYYALDLEAPYKITNIIKGPNFGNGLSVHEDVDSIDPGDFGSMFSSSSASNVDVAFSNVKTDDPSKVVWGSFGEESSGFNRWILVRSRSGIIDELAVHVDDNDNSLKRAFPSTRWWTASLGEVTKDNLNFKEGADSIKVDYAANQGPSLEEIEVQQSFGIDHILAKRDQLRIWFYVSDVSLLDLAQGHIALGRNIDEENGGNNPLSTSSPDRDNYYQWDFSDLTTLISSGWNELFLPFSDNFKVGQPNLTKDDYLEFSSTDISARSRIRWFRIQFAGVEGNDLFTVGVDGFDIVRGDFLPGKFGNGLYLSGKEQARFPLTNFNTLKGSIEFYLNTDWTKAVECNSCDNPIDHTIFRFSNSDGYVLGAFMTGEGLKIYFTDGEKQYFLTDNNSKQIIAVGKNTHFAVTWDILGEESDSAIQVFVDNVLSSEFSVSDIVSTSFKPNSNVTLLLGGIGWDGVVISLAESVGGIVENIKVYNYPKTDFSYSLENQGLEYIRPSDELIEISLNGVDFYGSGDRGTNIPLLSRNVLPGESFNVYVRNKEQQGTSAVNGQSRTSFVRVLKARAG